MVDNKTGGSKTYAPEVFSFGIVCYRNWEFLKEAIDSALMQDYSQIQLIVSDDGSDHFPANEFEQYIVSHKRDNLVSYTVRHSEKNEGTVRHLNRVLECVEGEYIMFMAADDTLDNSSVFSRYVQAFQKEGDKCGVVMGQTAFYDITMSKFLEYYVWPDVIDAINHADSGEALLNALYHFPCIPTTSTCFRRWVIDQYTPFDTDYQLIEDYPFHLKLAENNVKMHYENFVAARHRDGGISHGAVTALSRSKRMYYEDCILARKTVLKKIQNTQVPENIKCFNEFQIAAHDRMLLATGNKRKDFLRYAVKYPQYAINDASSHANERRTVKWGILMGSFLILYFLAPECASILSSVVSFIPSDTLCVVLSALFLSISCLLGIFTIAELILLLAAGLGKFPEELDSAVNTNIDNTENNYSG